MTTVNFTLLSLLFVVTVLLAVEISGGGDATDTAEVDKKGIPLLSPEALYRQTVEAWQTQASMSLARRPLASWTPMN